MADSYIVLCSRCKQACLTAAGYVGRPLNVWFGGQHTAAPRFGKFGVRPGDAVYAVAVRGGVMHIVTRLVVAELMTIPQYLETHFGVSQGTDVRWWEEAERLAAERPELRPLLPIGCLDEAAVGSGTAVRFDRAVPVEVLERLRLRSRTGPERGLAYLTNGRLMNVQTLLGRVYRLADGSAEDFAALDDSPGSQDTPNLTAAQSPSPSPGR